MSIFKSTLDPIIASQLKARESVVGTTGSRSDNFLKYTTGKNSWVRMTSFVNYNDSDALSKKYILEGGTLNYITDPSGKPLATLRAGVGKQSGAYASNIDINTISGKQEIVRPFGLRPMPGILQASVVNKSAYGSLREATVEFLAWDKHQLEELEILFMRPGYTVFLEWGWSQYLDHEVVSINQTPKDINIKNFDLLTLNPFTVGLTDEKIYNEITGSIEATKGNYDAMLGYVKNFSWQLLPNGGFQCSTVLISRGEVLESLKASATTNTNFSFNNTNSQTKEQVVATMFENILLSIMASINDNVYNSTFSPTSGLSIPGELWVTGSNPVDLIAEADRKYNDINSKVKQTYPNIDLDNETCVKYCDGHNEGTAIEYISMNSFVSLLNTYLIPKQKSKNITNIEIPGNTPCLASEDSVSIDPTTCIIKNKKANFIADNKEGFDPYVESSFISNVIVPSKATLRDFLDQGTTSLGSIGNIYISINKILTIFRTEASKPDGVTVLTLLQEVLNNISFALGGINDFKIHSVRGTAQIIDLHYLESGKQNNKFEFNLVGLKSICRDVKINSRIFSEQSTMIGIGAAAAGSFNNLGDIYASTQQKFNKGLKDRILNNIYYDAPPINVGGRSLNETEAYYYSIFKTLEGLKKYITDKVLGIPNGGPTIQYTIIPEPSEITNASNALKTIHYQLNGKDVNFKALIPFELEITLDGIGGFVIGQIFTIDNSILPQDYYNKNLGFIITGINHKLQNNDWITELKTQICLLDTVEELRAIGVEQNKVKKIINTLTTQSQTNSYLVNALADFLVYQTVKNINAYDPVNITNYLSSNDINPLTSEFNARTILTGNDTTPPVDRRYILQLLQACSPDSNDLIKFLDDWWDMADKSLPGFPQNKVSFITQTNNGTSVQFDPAPFVNSFLIDSIVYNKYINDVFLTTSQWDATVYNKYKEIFDSSYLGAYFSDNRSTGLTIKIDTNPPLPPSYPIKLQYPNGQVYNFYNSQRPTSDGTALNDMRSSFYNFFQLNPQTRGLGLSIYLSSNPQITDLVNIIPN